MILRAINAGQQRLLSKLERRCVPGCLPPRLTANGLVGSSQAESSQNNARKEHMAARRILLEVGTGNDWHGRDYTKAAVRAVQDAIHHRSLTLLKSLSLDANSMLVEVTIGVQRPELVDRKQVQAALPHGDVRVQVVPGGLDVPNQGSDDITVIANAAIAVSVDIRLASDS